MADSNAGEQSPVLTIAKVASMLRLSLNSTYKAVHSGQIPTIRIGRRILVSRKALELMLDGSSQNKEAAR